jgi:neurofilament heavy polypeptide
MAAPPATTADPKKAEPKKAAPKKAAPKKAPAKAPPKKVDGKPAATSARRHDQKYEAGKAPDLKDSKGNTIPTRPMRTTSARGPRTAEEK